MTEGEEWRTGAACSGVDPNTFILSKGADSSEALSYCNRCEVRDPCFEYAKEHKHVGIWGGVNFRRPGVPFYNTIQDGRPKKIIPEGKKNDS